jgi:hypothetical protein
MEYDVASSIGDTDASGTVDGLHGHSVVVHPEAWRPL